MHIIKPNTMRLVWYQKLKNYQKLYISDSVIYDLLQLGLQYPTSFDLFCY